jgi:peptidoglycan-associated lipoprotein
MKLTRFAVLLLIGVLTLTAAGCRKRPTGVTNIPGHAQTGPGDQPPDGAIPPDPNLNPDTTVGLRPLPDADAHKGWGEYPDILKAHTVYFDYDSAALKALERSRAAAVADHLKNNPLEAVRVEGNCDSRGTEEYNRSLGERRALAAREVLLDLGIDASRVDTKSWGEDNPFNAAGQDESAWRQNRRADFILLRPPQQ